MSGRDVPDEDFELRATRERYEQERARRLTPDRGALYDLNEEPFAGYRRDPFTPIVERESRAEEVDVLVVGAGMAGVVVGAKLHEVGIEQVVLVDEAGGIGGTWYWNRYPGVMCDVESYIYMPMLEEMGYVPSMRYASGEEIRTHLESIADQYRLVDDALFHTRVESTEWDESRSRWIVRTDRGDEVAARFVIMAVGILNLMQLPAIPGIESFKGPSFHSARWDYELTGGSPDDPDLDRLSGSVVGVIGSGATTIQALAPLAASACQVFVFQRTPSAVGVRGNGPTDEAFRSELRPGWQRERMENFASVFLRRLNGPSLVNDGWTEHTGRLMNPDVVDSDPAAIAKRMEEIDFEIMQEHRARIDEIVTDPTVAEQLKPWYRYPCKRPCFHDEYLAAFNEPNVTLVDCSSGVERITERGLVANGIEFDLDVIIFATGFEGEQTPFARRAGHPIVGTEGLSIEEKWQDGVVSLHGMTTRGFPNLFVMPAPAQQAVITYNYTHPTVIGAEHIAATISMLAERGVACFEVEQAAEDAWTESILATHQDNSSFQSRCTPSRLNFNGDLTKVKPKNSHYGGGLGDLFAYQDLLAEWRADGRFAGWELRSPASDGSP